VDIPSVIAAALDTYIGGHPSSVADVLEADRSGRDLARAALKRHARSA
jgi:hypothetical protein